MEFLFFVAICYLINKFSGDKDKINFKCPYCRKSVTIDYPGTWNCPHCENTFHYKPDGRILRGEESINEGIVLLAKLYGKLTKADGVVSTNEIQVIDNILKEGLELVEVQRKEFSEIFNASKHQVEEFTNIISNLYPFYQSHPEVLNYIIHTLIDIAKADGGIHPKQEEIIRFTANTFYPMTNKRYEDFIQEEKGSSSASSYNRQGLDQWYEVLECTPNASDQDLKRAYRRLIQKYHPDKYQSKDLPEDMVEYASKRFKEIQSAYEEIKKQRNFV